MSRLLYPKSETNNYKYKYVPLTKENSLLVCNDDGGNDRLDLSDETSKLDLVSGEYFSRLAGFPWWSSFSHTVLHTDLQLESLGYFNGFSHEETPSP